MIDSIPRHPLAGPGLFGPGPQFAPTGGPESGQAVPGVSGDGTSLSPEAFQPEAQMGALLQSLMQAFGQQQTPEQRIQQLMQEIKVTEQQLGQAVQAQDQRTAQALAYKLQALKAELAQLTGQNQENQQGGQAAAPESGGSAPAPVAAPAQSAPSGGGGGGGRGGGAPSSGGSAPSTSAPAASGESSAPTEVNTVPPELAGDDKKLAQYIEGKLEGTPLAGQGMGAHFVAEGRKNKVDPLALVAISRHETRHGELGVGVVKHMGVGAFDSSPSAPRQWDGAVEQIRSGAKTFARLREKGGSNAEAPLEQQLSAVNRGGWATDSSWHSKVGKHYNEITSDRSRRAA